MSIRHPSSSMLDMYAAGSLTTSAVQSATPGAAMRLAIDRQRLLLSMRHYYPPPTVSAPTAAATNLLDPSAFCLPAVSIFSIKTLLKICVHRAIVSCPLRSYDKLLTEKLINSFSETTFFMPFHCGLEPSSIPHLPTPLHFITPSSFLSLLAPLALSYVALLIIFIHQQLVDMYKLNKIN